MKLTFGSYRKELQVMYKHRVKRMGGGGAAIRIFYNLSLRTSHYLSPEGGLGGRFFFWGGGVTKF